MFENGGGLAAVEEACQHYGRRARELKAAGQRIVGYLCAYVPLEIITAAGLIPFRIRGDAREPIHAADALMENLVCSRVRGCFDLSLKRRYEFLDGLVIPHACDSIARTYPIWSHTLGLPFSRFLDRPHGTDDSSVTFFKQVLISFSESLGKYAGSHISNEALRLAVALYNENRAAIRALYELRRLVPSLISGTEVTTALIAGASLPVEESTRLIQSVVSEACERPNPKTANKPRIIVVGAELDASFIRLAEAAGADIVADDLCPGARESLPMTDVTDDPMDGIARRYLRKIDCPCTCSEQKGNYDDYLQQRFGDVTRRIGEYRVEGVILYFYRYCDPFWFDAPAMKSHFDSLSVPVLYLEDEYSLPASGRLTTRVQAFLEVLGAQR